MMASNRLHIFAITIILLLVSSCSVRQSIRQELRRFQKSKASLSLEIDAVRDRNIGRESLQSEVMSMVMYYFYGMQPVQDKPFVGLSAVI